MAKTESDAKYAVIGDPVEHSLSPAIFSWLRDEGIFAGEYDAWKVHPDALSDAISMVRTGWYQGLSVTLPHKERALKIVDTVDPLGWKVGAVNCVARMAQGGALGFNTDVAGVVRALAESGVSMAGQSVLVVGAGGGARAAVCAAVEEKATEILVANRTFERAEALCRALGGGLARPIHLDPGELQRALGSAGVLVQATRVGLKAEQACVLPESVSIPKRLAVLDMVYQPLETELLRRARAAQATCVDGLWMLIHQALQQLYLWTGSQVGPDVPAKIHRHLREAAL